MSAPLGYHGSFWTLFLCRCGERDVSAAARPARRRLHAFVRHPLV